MTEETYKPTLDIEQLQSNCAHYSELHEKAVEVIRKADGKTHYKKIAGSLHIHPTTVSGLLSTARKLGLAVKKDGLYKKKPGILQYMPKRKKKPRKGLAATELVAKAIKKRSKSPNPSKSERAIFKDRQTEKMSEAYYWLYLSENTLRQLIRNTFKYEAGWWKKRVNKGIRDEVREAIRDYPYDGAVRADELEYTHLGQLKEIFIRSDNWKILKLLLNEQDKEKFRVTIDRAIPSRNSIAHCTPLTNEDLKVVRIRFQDILSMIK